MGMYESAERLNKDLKNLFDSVPIESFTAKQREDILNIIIRFGAVAKYRCRSNKAYDNFVDTCFGGIAKTNRVKPDDDSKYDVLRATILK